MLNRSHFKEVKPTQDAETIPCQKNHSYMKMHVSDFYKNEEIWNRTLYTPLQDNVLKLIDGKAKERNNFVYIGVGSNAPLFQNDELVTRLKSQFTEITLVDISEEALEKSKEIASKKFPELKINVIASDITQGLYKKFEVFIEGLFEKIKHNHTHAYNKNDFDFTADTHEYKTNQSLSSLFERQQVPKANFVYSEMVATFTGTPTMFWLEDKLKGVMEKNQLENIHSANIASFLKNCYVAWQKFNDHSFQLQLENYASVIKESGLIAIAGDTSKIFDDKDLPPVSTFYTQNNNFPDINQEYIRLNHSFAPILWRDVANIDTEVSVKAHDPHSHLVNFNVYEVQKTKPLSTVL